MTLCNRCGAEFDNYFRGYHWCPSCGKVFMYDENVISEKEKDVFENKRLYFDYTTEEVKEDD